MLIGIVKLLGNKNYITTQIKDSIVEETRRDEKRNRKRTDENL